VSGDIFIGVFHEDKKFGAGRMFYADKGEIYDGEWSNDQRMGKGHIINRQGEIVFGDFRSDFMDGKQTYLRTLAKSETDKIFQLIESENDWYVAVEKKKTKL
jgi:hypothetical protein